MSKIRNPSMVDVAEKSGVSHQTVSRVLNNHKNVSEKTRTKVLKAMEDLGYRPNLMARALVTGKTATIGVLSHDTTLFGPASTLHAVQSAAREKGYKTTIFSLKGEDRDSIIAGIRELMSDAVDGIVIIAPQIQSTKEVSDVIGNFPAVLVESESSASLPSVNVDQFYGAYEITKHLISLGHKSIAHITGPKDWYETEQRLKGFQKAMIENKLEKNNLWEGDWSASSGYEAAVQIIKKKKISAIFAGNDAMALGALKAISQLGFNVPGDISLVGFDDLPESRFLTPSLTTARQDFHEVGEQALAVLLGLINRKKSRMNVAIKPEILIRDSTAKVK
jgi:DNA-binding LacI/PurR family transcriptional regulator